MFTQNFTIETELSLIDVYKLHLLYPEVTFDIYPMKREPLLFDAFDTENLSKEQEYALWDIIEILNELVAKGGDLRGVETLMPANLRLAGRLEMPLYRAMSMVEEQDDWNTIGVQLVSPELLIQISLNLARIRKED